MNYGALRRAYWPGCIFIKLFYVVRLTLQMLVYGKNIKKDIWLF
jgi:hypothetical protein